ncbi:MAG: hemerythrin domain-containing protein [Rhizobiaceae bacterium]|nr:hemerythrin domain-containing protein [Rhizobiaceae bacterium]
MQKIVSFPKADARSPEDEAFAQTRQRDERAMASIPDPLGFMARAHQDQLRICELLEEIADSLPSRVDRLKCFYAAGKLRTTMRIHHLDEERGLFPALRRHAQINRSLASSLERLESEHIEDDSLSQDIIDALERLASGEAVSSVDGLSFMLRAFFDSHRRHIAFEDEMVLPAARQHLDRAELEDIEAVMLANRRMSPDELFSRHLCSTAMDLFRGEFTEPS